MSKQIPLAMISSGETVTVVSVKAGWGLTRRLADMGLIPGTKLTVINGQMSGPVILDVRGSRLVLGHGMAQKILVELQK